MAPYGVSDGQLSTEMVGGSTVVDDENVVVVDVTTVVGSIVVMD